MLIIKNLIIVYALCTILKFVKTIEYALPNMKLMIFHFVNVLILTLVYLTAGTLFAASHLYLDTGDQERELIGTKLSYYYAIVNNVSGFFQVYNVLFIYSMILLFISQRPKIDLNDTLLGKKVPSIVFIQN